MYETFITQTNVDLCLESLISLNYRFSHFNLTYEPAYSRGGAACGNTLEHLSNYLSLPPSSILDVVAYNCFLEVVPAVISVLGVTHFSVGHTAHGANVRLNALFLVVWNGHCGQVNCQVLFEDVVELDVFLELGSRSLLCNCVLFL